MNKKKNQNFINCYFKGITNNRFCKFSKKKKKRKKYACTQIKHFQDCVPGFFGENCLQKCGKCKSGEACNTLSGLCPDGCQDHLMPPFCKGSISKLIS